MRDDRLRVGVLCGGPSSEHDVSLATGLAVLRALDPARFRTFAVAVHRDGTWSLPAERIPDHERDLECFEAAPSTASALQALAELDVAFNALHGSWGEDGRVQGLLDSLGVPYTGSGVLASALAFDKVRCRRLLAGARIPLAAGRTFRFAEGGQPRAPELAAVARLAARLGYPLCIKPAAGGSSVGVSRVDSPGAIEQAVHFACGEGEEILLEHWEEGVEVTVPVLGNTGARSKGQAPRALPVIEIVPRAGAFFDFRSKYTEGGADEVVPARIDAGATRRLKDLGVRVHRLLGCEGLSRVDMILTPRGPVVLEINTLPGLTSLSLFPRSAAAAGLAFPDLCVRLLELAGVAGGFSGRRTEGQA